MVLFPAIEKIGKYPPIMAKADMVWELYRWDKTNAVDVIRIHIPKAGYISEILNLRKLNAIAAYNTDTPPLVIPSEKTLGFYDLTIHQLFHLSDFLQRSPE